jgi:hypothetical protein
MNEAAYSECPEAQWFWSRAWRNRTFHYSYNNNSSRAGITAAATSTIDILTLNAKKYRVL